MFAVLQCLKCCSCVCVGVVFQVCFFHLLILSCGIVKVDTVSLFSVLFYFLRRWLSFGVIVFLHLKRSCYSLSLLLFIFRYFICCLQKKFQFNVKVRYDSFSAFGLNIRLYSCLVFHNSRKFFFDCCYVPVQYEMPIELTKSRARVWRWKNWNIDTTAGLVEN